jgi:uncharacterized repeat protein (TIGR01451 family)
VLRNIKFPRSVVRVVVSISLAAFSMAGVVAIADFVNGGFEDGTLSSWTVTTYTRGNNTVATPVEETLRSGLSLTAGGTDNTSVVSGSSTESEYDVNLGASSTLRFPLFGVNSARVNYKLTSSTNANSLKQTITITTADVDTYDNKAHVRFAVAPVLEDGSHSAAQQPYYFVNVRNITKNTTLYHSFKYANQPGVPWKQGTGNYVYTDWQLVDVSPGAGTLDVGDSVEIEVIGARCAPTGHSGYVYVDGFGAFLPGLNVVGSGPQAANENTDITYTYVYRNGAATPVTNATITLVLPSNVTFVSMNTPGVTCTTPSVGATGTVTCNMGTLPQNALGSIQMVVHIDAAYSGTIGHGNYSIDSDQSSALLGPLVRTTVTTGVSYADLEVDISNGAAAVEWGGSSQYLVTVTNNGPSAVTGATVAYTPPVELTNVTWTCSGSGTAVCTASGTGSVNDTVNLGVGESVVFVIDADIVAGSGTQAIAHTATVTAPGGVTESDTNNNTAVDSESVGTLSPLTVTKNVAAGGTVASSPAALSCGTSCSSESKSFLDGGAVTLSAVAATNFSFTGWSGGGCTGTGSCTLVVSGATSVTATFDCASDYFGATCATQCPGNGTCNGRGTCGSGISGTGQCTCSSGYSGTACEIQPGVDSDGDAIPDSTEGATDADADGRANYLDLDSDNDGVLDSTEGATDADADGKGNYVDADSDADGIVDVIEKSTVETFVGPVGSDSNGDGVDNAYTTFPTVDTDSDGAPDYLDLDSDGDGTSDGAEAFDTNRDGVVDVTPSGIDANGDGLDDAFSLFSTPLNLNSEWRQLPTASPTPPSSPAGNQCTAVNISAKTSRAAKAREVLLGRSNEFANRARRCGGSAAKSLKAARVKSKAVQDLLDTTYGGSLYTCSKMPANCTVKNVANDRKRLQSLASALGATQKAVKLKAIASCPKAPDDGNHGRRKATDDYTKDLVDAIKALPTAVTRCS